jgi:hypothetical protein
VGVSAQSGASSLPLNVRDSTGVSRGRTLDIEVTFALPPSAGRFGVVFCANESAGGPLLLSSKNVSNSGKFVYVDYTPNASRLPVGVLDGGSNGAHIADALYGPIMPGLDLPALPNLQTYYKPPDNQCDPTNGNSGACWVRIEHTNDTN